MSYTRQFLLSTLIFFSFISILSSEKIEGPKSIFTKKLTKAVSFSAKLATACSAALGAHYVLEYVSTYMHEHGHGMASGGDYIVTMIANNNILEPLHGITHYKNSAANPLLTTLAGPLAGISATYIQIIALKMLDEHMHNKSLRTSLHEGLKFPITFFINAVKTGKKYGSMMLNLQSTSALKNKTLTEFTIDGLLFLRMGRLVGESIYGLLPYYDQSVIGDGEKIWKTIFGPHVPTFTGNLAGITLVIISSPYIIGAAQAVYEKVYKKQPSPIMQEEQERITNLMN